uniref:Uncharacterized protein n=1 Tax=Meloidogyne javanica TaxID=6303 RepID=A0A915MMW6_MELJA
MKILTLQLILHLLFLLVLDLKELDAGNSCKGQNATATGRQRPNKGKGPMKDEEQIGEDVLNTIHIYGSEGESPMFTVKGGKVKIYHASLPEEGRCVAIKFIIKLNSATEDAARKEIGVFERFYESGLDEESRIIDYFGHEENSLQVMNKNLQVSSIVMELGEKNLLAYYADIIKNGPNNVELLTSFLISSAESLDQFHKRIF